MIDWRGVWVRASLGGMLAMSLAGGVTESLAGSPPERLRERVAVDVSGVREEWALVWERVRGTWCGPDEVDMAATCPCSGWAYGEFGDLALVRRRQGREVERLRLNGLFDEADAEPAAGAAILQRWPARADDLRRAEGPGLAAAIRRRPASAIMKLADYDRDGAANEFLLQVATLPCGKHQFVAIGVSAAHPGLHALVSAAHPERPLVMPLAAWTAAARGNGPTRVTTLACGDHGSEVRSELVVTANAGVVRALERNFSCPEDGRRERLLEETPL